MNTLRLPKPKITDTKITPLEWYSILCVLMLVALIYSPVLTNAFNGDDFVHLKWLHQAVSQPELIWRNFHSSWLDLTTAKFYRPLISIFMLGDYIIWHSNGIGFHLTNLLCHLANTLLLWLVLKNIISRQYQIRSFSHQIWCLSAAAMFGLYPSHPEAVTWITGRVDTIVTFFFLCAFLGYLYWRQSNRRKWLVLSIIAFVCGLLSKEMAIMLPAVLFMYELIFGYANARDRILKAVASAFKYSLIFWLILLSYFLWRCYALGTLIGGYDSTLLPHDRYLLIYLWKHSLYMLVVPFNQSLLTNGKSIITLWVALLLFSVALCIKQILADKESRPIFIFLCSWLVLSLVPVYKLFNIGTDLQGSRLAYMATVPLAMLICFGLSGTIQNSNSKKINYWAMVALSIMVSAAGAGLLMNNCAWIKAEAASQAIMQQLNDLSKTIPTNTVVYIVGLPDEINGAYVCRNALDGMTKYPQINKDVNNCFNLSEIDHIFPFGYALHSMNNVMPGDQLPQFFIWKADQQKLQQLKLLPQSIDFIKIYCTGNKMLIKKFPPYVIYKNDLRPQGVRVASLALEKEGEFIVPLHSQADWILGGKYSDLQPELSPECAKGVSIKYTTIVPANKIMPVLSFKGAANQYIVGYIELNKSHPACQLYYDASKITDAKNISVESTPPNKTFAAPNDPSPQTDTIHLYKKLSGLSGTFSLTKTDFPEPGIYALRLRAIGENNNYIGVAGDHIIITVR